MIELESHKAALLLQISRELSHFFDLENFLQRIVDTATELTNSQASSICLYEQETQLLKFVAAPRSHKERMRRFRVPLENSVAGKVFTHRKPFVLQDASEDPLVYRAVDQELPFVTYSIAAVPIIYRDEPLGVIEALNKHMRGQYTDDDVQILQLLADYAATAIFNTALLEEAQNARSEAADLERLKSDFIAIVSHEFRTPLGLILGHATFLNETIQLAQYKQQLGVILENTMRIKEIIDDFAHANIGNSGSTKLQRQRIDIGALIDEVIEEFRLDAQRKNITIKTNLPAKLLLVEVEPERIALAIRNLLRNAITFTDVNGKVVVAAEQLPGYIKVAVIDNGVGIPAKDLQRVFDRFYQVESHYTRKHGGMGLGLAVAKTMVELHGGQIWAESIEGKGSNFSILLPEAGA